MGLKTILRAQHKIKIARQLKQVENGQTDKPDYYDENGLGINVQHKYFQIMPLKSWSRSSTSYKNLLATPFLPLLAPSTTISVGVNVGCVSNLEGSS